LIPARSSAVTQPVLDIRARPSSISVIALPRARLPASSELRVLREAFMGSNLQVAVLACERCDFAATRAASFVAAEGITV